MDKAIFTNKPWKYDLSSYDRVYFGNEFCEQNIIHPKKIIDYIKDKKFTYVTPFLTDKGIGIIRKNLRMIPKGTEVVFNDYGLLPYLKKHRPVYGRLLNKQKRGPRIVQLKKHISKETYSYFQKCNIDAMGPSLRRNKIYRAEIDNVIQGFKIETKLKLSLYFPYVYVSSSRACRLNDIENLARKQIRIKPCKKECNKYTFINDKFPLKMILHGNTQFYFNNKIPKKGYDRLVFMPEIIV